jgi:hypothetical protein
MTGLGSVFYFQPFRASVIPKERRAAPSDVLGTLRATEESTVGMLVTRRRARYSRLQPAKADFALFQRRIHSPPWADRTVLPSG